MTKYFTPKLRFKMAESSWQNMLYGEIYTFYTTNSFSRDNLNYENGQVKNIHYGDIHTKFATLFNIQKEEVPFVNPEIDIKKIKDESYCQEGDLVIADASEDYADIGKTIELSNLNNERIIAGLHTFLARPNKHEMAKGFAGYLVQSWKFRKQVMVIAQGTKVLSLSTGRLANVKLNIPSLPEQQKIASFLSAVDEKIQQLTRKKELLEQYKKGVMQQLFSGKLRFKDENGKAFPKWEEKRLGDVFEFFRGSPISKSDLSETGKYLCIHYGELFTSYSEVIKSIKSKTDLENRFLSIKGDILMPSSDVTPKGLAKASSIQMDNVILGGDMNILRPTINYDSIFFSYLLNFNQQKIIQKVTGTTVKHIYNRDVKLLDFNIPKSLEEQKKIADYLSNIDNKIESVTKQISQTQTFKKGLLQQMFV